MMVWPNRMISRASTVRALDHRIHGDDGSPVATATMSSPTKAEASFWGEEQKTRRLGYARGLTHCDTSDARGQVALNEPITRYPQR